LRILLAHALIDRLVDWVLPLLILGCFFFSVLRKKVVNFNVWIAFLRNTCEVILGVLLRDDVLLQVVND